MRSIALALVVTLAGCTQASVADDPIVEPAEAPVVRFVVLGDMGTGEQAQFDVAAAMQEVCRRDGCDFVIGVGDNIYEVGVTSHYDPQFVTKFETPYEAFDIPFYMSLGNHDNMGVRSGHAGGDFQVMYHHRMDRMSEKWFMPDRWYSHQQEHIQFIALDTNLVFEEQGAVPGAAGLLSKDVDGVRQKAFLEEQLRANATWRLLYGHHPLYSNGDHGDTGGPAGRWLHDVVCGSGTVDLYLTGHDHDLQWLEPDPACGDTTFIVSGAGAKMRSIESSDHAAYFTKGDTLGFFWAQIDGDRLTGRFYDDRSELLFERTYTRTAGDLPG